MRINAQINQGIIPASLIRPDSRMAKFLPITVMLPLAKYRKGRGGLWPSISLAMNPPTYRPCWIATCATPGSGRPSCISVAASPTTNIPRASATLNDGPTDALPVRSVATPSILTIGEGETPAVHSCSHGRVAETLSSGCPIAFISSSSGSESPNTMPFAPPCWQLLRLRST